MIECIYTSETKIVSGKFDTVEEAIEFLKHIKSESDELKNIIIPRQNEKL